MLIREDPEDCTSDDQIMFFFIYIFSILFQTLAVYFNF